MKKTTATIKALLFLCLTYGLQAQNNQPEPSAAMQIQASDKGLLIPRVALQNLTDTATIKNPANGLLIYNTSKNVQQKLSEGFYYFKKNTASSLENQWVRVLSLDKNGTIDGVDYIKFKVYNGLTSDENGIGLGGTITKDTTTINFNEKDFKFTGLKEENNATKGVLVLDEQSNLKRSTVIVDNYVEIKTNGYKVKPQENILFVRTDLIINEQNPVHEFVGRNKDKAFVLLPHASRAIKGVRYVIKNSKRSNRAKNMDLVVRTADVSNPNIAGTSAIEEFQPTDTASGAILLKGNDSITLFSDGLQWHILNAYNATVRIGDSSGIGHEALPR